MTVRVTYKSSLKAGRRGDQSDAARLAVVIEMSAADWGTRTCSVPYAFSPEAVWEAARRKGLDAAQVAYMLDQHGPDAATALLADQ